MKIFIAMLIILLLCFGQTLAQYDPGSSFMILNFGWTMANPDGVDADIDGNTFSLSYEKTDFEGVWSLGFALAYSKMSADSVTANGQSLDRLNKLGYEVLPISVFCKAMFGSEKLRAYVGAGLGIHFSNITYFTNNVQVTAFESGILLSGLAGGYFFISESVFLNANYSLNWMNNSYYENSMAHNINLGLGFQFD
jgi:hypothetical protein